MAFLGQSLRSQQITIINGVMQQASGAREFHYRLTPKKSGDLKIPAPLLKVGGKTLTGAAQRLIVQPPTAQDLVAVELTADRQAVYPTQPFTVTLSVLVKGLPPPMADRDPMSVQRRPPMLKIPWLPDQELPGGLSPQEDWQAWAKRFIDRDSVGFGINELVQESAFSVFGGGSALAFRPKPQSMARPDAQGHEATYFRYDFPRTFTAKQVGPITLGAVTLQGTFGNEVSEAGRLTGRDIYAASKPLAITVKDVPQEGRPDCYVGAIGQFQVSAALTPRQSKVGDPMTFTLTLRGSGSLAGAKAARSGQGSGARRAVQGVRGHAKQRGTRDPFRLLAPPAGRGQRAVLRRRRGLFRRRSRAT